MIGATLGRYRITARSRKLVRNAGQDFLTRQ
jgi:hypothetical protein